jgi:hypothetical protein
LHKRHDITEMLLKVPLSTINLNLNYSTNISGYGYKSTKTY